MSSIKHDKFSHRKPSLMAQKQPEP